MICSVCMCLTDCSQFIHTRCNILCGFSESNSKIGKRSKSVQSVQIQNPHKRSRVRHIIMIMLWYNICTLVCANQDRYIQFIGSNVYKLKLA